MLLALLPWSGFLPPAFIVWWPPLKRPTSKRRRCSGPLGRQFRDFGEALPVELNSDFEQRAGGQAGLPATDMLELYLTSLLIDGRDAPRWHDRNAPFVVLAQPLKAELLPDRIELTVSNQSLKLPSLGSEGAKLGLTIRVQSERPPPYPVVLEMNWDADLNVVRQDSGPAIRSGRNELRLDRELTEMEFRVSPRRESRDDSRASVRAQARFAQRFAGDGGSDVPFAPPRSG